MGTPPQLTTTMSRTESGRFGHARCPFRARKVPEHGLAADSSDGVVVLAADTVEDTTSIGLECTTGLDVDGNWAGGNSVHGISNTRYSSDAGSDCKTSSASTVSSSVSVGRAGV